MHGQAHAQLGTSANVPSQGPSSFGIAAPIVNPTDAALTPKLADIPENAIGILLEQAAFWRSQYRMDQAIDSLGRVLVIDPANADALAMLGQLQAEQGQSEAGRTTLLRLRETHPGDPRIAGIEQSLRAGPIDQTELAEARRLAQVGHAAEAVARYQLLFKGDVPSAGLAVEYYQTLGGMEDGFDKAREALLQIVIANPQDLRAQMAYARLETYRENTRDDGLRRLEGLATKSAVREQATQALRQALQWEPNDSGTVPELQLFLARNPGDPDITRKLAEAQASPDEVVDEGGKARIEGFQALQAGNEELAEAKFTRAIEISAQDAESMGGLGLVRFRQDRIDEARQLLTQAAAAEPAWNSALETANDVALNRERANQSYQQIQLSRTPGNTASDGRAAALISGQYRRVQALMAAGQYDAAESLLKKLMGGRGNWGIYYQLGDIQAHAGRLGPAEASFRRSLAMNPRSVGTKVGLAAVLDRAGRPDEARALLVGIDAGGGTPDLGQARAAELRRQAAAAADPQAKIDLLQAAVRAAPAEPWVRVDLARALDAAHRHAEAATVMDGVGDGPKTGKDPLQAALIYAEGRNDLQRASLLIDQVPDRSRTPQMRETQQRASVQADIAQATRGADASTARNALLSMASRPDSTGARGIAVARRLIAMNDKPGAREAVRLALAASPSQTAAQRLAYTNVLLEAGYERDASLVVQRVNPTSLPADQRIAYTGLQNGIAIQQSDKLNQKGQQAAAYDALSPRLAAQPASPDLNLALGRLYQSDKRPGEAMRINQAVLSQNPKDLDVRRAAAGAAAQAGDFKQADALVAEAMRTAPSDPRSYLMASDIARAKGNTGQALSDLRQARALRQQQIGPDAALSSGGI